MSSVSPWTDYIYTTHPVICILCVFTYNSIYCLMIGRRVFSGQFCPQCDDSTVVSEQLSLWRRTPTSQNGAPAWHWFLLYSLFAVIFLHASSPAGNKTHSTAPGVRWDGRIVADGAGLTGRHEEESRRRSDGDVRRCEDHYRDFLIYTNCSVAACATWLHGPKLLRVK